MGCKWRWVSGTFLLITLCQLSKYSFKIRLDELLVFFPLMFERLYISLKCTLCKYFLYENYSSVWNTVWFIVIFLFSTNTRLISYCCLFACSETAVKYILKPRYLSFIVYIFTNSLSHPSLLLSSSWIPFHLSQFILLSVEFLILLLI